jgi:hypothetical protein
MLAVSAFTLWAADDSSGSSASSSRERAPIKAFCIDFNWGEGGLAHFAKPGLWADASPEEHVAWYADLGCNVIQTFAVSGNGYAWYRGGKVPAQPGLKHDFLPEVVRLGHAKGMKVMGYICVGANVRWSQEHPELSYGIRSDQHIPLTDAYLDYLGLAVQEAVKLSGVDGFMVDWLCDPTDAARRDANKDRWLPCDQELFTQLLGKPFPADGRISAEDRQAYESKAIERCWRRIHDTAKRVKPDCVIWLSAHRPDYEGLQGNSVLKEADWMMDEGGRPDEMNKIASRLGPQTRQMLCVVGWDDRHDARRVLSGVAKGSYGVYGFAKPGANSLPLPVAEYRSRSIASFKGNDRNIAVLARYFTGASLE